MILLGTHIVTLKEYDGEFEYFEEQKTLIFELILSNPFTKISSCISRTCCGIPKGRSEILLFMDKFRWSNSHRPENIKLSSIPPHHGNESFDKSSLKPGRTGSAESFA